MTAPRPDCTPHFLGLGVMRGGTTWLWDRLNAHPDVWLTPVKELNYFTRRHPIMVPSSDTAPARPENQPHLFRQSLKRFKWERLTHYFRTYSPRTVAWRWRFYRGDLSPEWYRSLFDMAGDRLCGDITPHYAALSEAGVQEVVDTLPDARMMLILRDPIDRDWSHAVHWYTHNMGRTHASLTEQDITEHAANPSVRQRGDYVPILERWRRHVPADRLKILFFDDVRTRPSELFDEVQDFLGLRRIHRPDLDRAINQSGASRIPESIERHLAELHLPALEALADDLGGPVHSWLERARNALAR